MDVALYFLCHNPFLVYPDGLVNHILRKGKPRFMAAVFSIDAEKFVAIDYDGLNLPFRYIRGDGYEQMYVLIVTDIIDRATTTRLSQSLQEAAAYYVSFISEEDEKIHTRESLWTLLGEYNLVMPEVKLLHVKNAGSFVLFYPGGVRTFRSHEEVSTYLKQKLNYTEALMHTTTSNVFEGKNK